MTVRHIEAVKTNGQEFDFGAFGGRRIINGLGDLVSLDIGEFESDHSGIHCSISRAIFLIISIL